MILWQNVDVSGVPKVVEEEKKEKNQKMPVIQMSTRRTGQGSFWSNGKLDGGGYSMIMTGWVGGGHNLLDE